MKVHFFYLIWILAAFVFAACKTEKPDANKSQAMESMMNSADCAKTSNFICNEGLAFVKIGDSLPTVEAKGIALTGIKDTLISTEDYEAKGRIFYLTEGAVILVGAPLEKESATAGPDQSHVKTIRVLSSLFETPEKIKVGSTLGELRKVYADSLFEIQPASEGTLELKVPKANMHVNFILKPLQNDNAEDNPDLLNDIKAIAKESKISEIVLF